MQKRRKGPRHKRAATFREQEDIQQDCQADSETGGREVSSRIFYRDAESEWLDIVEESATTETE
jgi:hypothetical protein